MPNATVRAKARALPKPETAKAFVLRTLAAETRRLASLPDKAFEEKTSAPAPSTEKRSLLDVYEELETVRRLIDAAWMAAHALKPDDRDPLAQLLDIVDDKLRDAIAALETVREAQR